MKKFVVVVWFMCSVTCAQDLVIKEPCVDHKEGVPNREAAHSYFDEESNKLYLTYMDKKTLNLNVYSNMIKVGQYGFVRSEDTGLFNQVADALKKNEKEYYLFFSNPTTKEFSVQSINLIEKTTQLYPQALMLDRDEFYMYSFCSRGEFFLLASIRRTSNVNLYKYNFSTNQFEKTLIELDAITYDNNPKKIKVWDIVSLDNKVSYYNPDFFKYTKNASTLSDLDPKVISRQIKFYNSDHHLKITIDGYNNRTRLIDINLDTKKSEFNSFEFEKIGAPSNEVYKNSFLLDNYLFQVKVSDEKMLFTIHDIKSKELLNSFSCESKDSVISFANSPMYKSISRQTLFNDDSEKEFKKVKKMLRVCSENNVFVGAIKNTDGEIEVTIGSYFMIESSGSSMGGGPMAGGGGVSHGTGMYVGSSVSENLYYFKSLLSADCTSRMSGSIFSSYYDLLTNRQKELSCPVKAQTIFSVKNTYYLGYFSSRTPYVENEDLNGVQSFYCIEKFGPK